MSDSDFIKDLSLRLIDLKVKEDELVQEMQIIKSAYIMEIEQAWEVNPKDKSLSNATKRGLVVDELLLADEKYRAYSNECERIRQHIRVDQIELDFQRREFQRQNGNASITLALDRIAQALEH